MKPERRLRAILSADAVGYSRLMAEDDVATWALLEAQLARLREQVGRCRGRVVDAVGDNLLAEFESSRDAVQCALASQSLLDQANLALPEARRLYFRMGVTIGDVVREGSRIYGDGVNVAARLESLAPPGGICLSQAVFEQVHRYLPMPFEDAGEHRVKNLPYAVRIWRSATPGGSAPEDAQGATAALVARPAIVVLPFREASGAGDGGWFAEAISQEITTRLSLFRWFPVIAHATARAIARQGWEPSRIAGELGVRYLIDGTVQRWDGRVRITAHVMDARSSTQAWSQRYDRALDDLFALQDEMATAILGSLVPAIERTERDRVARSPVQALDAWDSMQRGAWHVSRLTREDLRLAREWLERAIRIDPRFSAAHTMLAVSLAHAIAFQWSDDPLADLRCCVEASDRAVALADDDATAHTASGWARAFTREYDRAAAAFARATELNPSYAAAHHGLGFTLSMRDRPEEAISSIERAVRLSPLDPFAHLYFGHLGQCHFQAGAFEEATHWVARSLELRPAPGLTMLLAACYGFLGRTGDARAVLEALSRSDPGFTLETLRRFLTPRLVELHLEGLRRAGWQVVLAG